MNDVPQDSTTLRDYVRVVRRRKWAIAQALVLVPVAAVLFSLHQRHLYRGSAEVVLNRQNLANSLNGIPDPNTYVQPDRFAQTQADVARVPAVAARTLEALHLRKRTPQQLLASSTVTPRANADLLEFSVTDADARLAPRLAQEYARQYSIYQRQLAAAPFERAQAEIKHRLKDLRPKSSLFGALVEKEQQLRSMEALQTPNYVVHGETSAVQVQPKPVRNGILGIALGLVLGIGFAFLWEALDIRVRSADEVAAHLGLPLLARIPEPPRRLRGQLLMLEAPAGAGAEAFRLLRTNLEFANLGRGARTIMISSAGQAEGKSTTIANLAVAVARTGKRVALVDLDLRRPIIARYFGLGAAPGVTDVALGRVKLDEALARVVVAAPATAVAPEPAEVPELETWRMGGNGNGSHQARLECFVDVLPCGPIPPDAGEFVGTRALEQILGELRDRTELVLIDAPPLLHVGDAIALSAKVDAIVVATRLNVVKKPALTELHRVLRACPATKLGFVVTGAETDEAYGYDGYYRYHESEPATPSAETVA